jgi:hypothetical protein
MLSKSDALSMLADLEACERDLEILKNDPRELEEIFNDPRARNKNGDILLHRNIFEEIYQNNDEYIYDIFWINDGPCGDKNREWTDYTYEETIDMLCKEHKLWREDKEKWINEGGGGYVPPGISMP